MGDSARQAPGSIVRILPHALCKVRLLAELSVWSWVTPPYRSPASNPHSVRQSRRAASATNRRNRILYLGARDQLPLRGGVSRMRSSSQMSGTISCWNSATRSALSLNWPPQISVLSTARTSSASMYSPSCRAASHPAPAATSPTPTAMTQERCRHHRVATDRSLEGSSVVSPSGSRGRGGRRG
jgi:hypothetical protein